jgi:hypothetical protein
MAAAERIDRSVDRLPGLSGLNLLQSTVSSAASGRDLYSQDEGQHNEQGEADNDSQDRPVRRLLTGRFEKGLPPLGGTASTVGLVSG